MKAPKGLFVLTPDLVGVYFLEGSVDVEQGQVISLAGGELLSCGKTLLSAYKGVVEHRVHRQQRNDGQHLLGTLDVWRQQDGL